MENSQIQRQRENFTQQIRKKNREQKFSKKRNTTSVSHFQAPESSSMEQEKHSKKQTVVDDSRKQLIINLINEKYFIEMLPELAKLVFNGNIQQKHKGVIGIRKIISVDTDPPIQQVIDAKLVPELIEMSKQSLYPQLQLQATWILTNVCSGNTQQCESVIDKGGIQIFVQLLIENKPGIVEQAIWAIGNLSGDCVKYRDMVIKSGALDHLIKISNTTNDKNIVQQVAWTISNLCRGTPLPKYDNVKHGIVALCFIIKADILDRQNLIDCLWAVSYGCQTQKSKIQRVVETGIVEKLISMCDTPYLNVLTPTLRILGNISVGNELQTEELIKNGLLDISSQLIEHDKKGIRRETCWILSNIAAGTATQVNQLICRSDLIKKILHLFEQDTFDIKREICYVFSNMINYGESAKVFQLYMQEGIINYYSRMLMENPDAKSLEICLDTLYTALSLGQKVRQKTQSANMLVNQLMNFPGLADTIQKLQFHESKSIYVRVVKILQKYFDLEQDLIL